MPTICSSGVAASPSELVRCSTDLVSLPDIVFQINEMMHDPGKSTKDLGDVMSKDPALSVKLLKIVNSSFYGFQTRIDTLGRAITVVGVEDLRNLVLAASAVDTFNRIPQNLVDMTDFWIRSITCGIAARILAKRINVMHSERLFTAGLLHDIGSLLMYCKMPDASREVLLAADGDHRLMADLEIEMLGYSYADVGAELTEYWGLPEALTDAIRYQLDPLREDNNGLDACLVYLGKLCFNTDHNGYSIEQAIREIPGEILERVRISEDELLAEIYQIPEHFAEVINLILPKTRVCY